MEKNKGTDTKSPGPINLDQKQLEELSKLIDNLKKEIVFPQIKRRREEATQRTSGG